MTQTLYILLAYFVLSCFFFFSKLVVYYYTTTRTNKRRNFCKSTHNLVYLLGLRLMVQDMPVIYTNFNLREKGGPTHVHNLLSPSSFFPTHVRNLLSPSSFFPTHVRNLLSSLPSSSPPRYNSSVQEASYLTTSWLRRD